MVFTVWGTSRGHQNMADRREGHVGLPVREETRVPGTEEVLLSGEYLLIHFTCSSTSRRLVLVGLQRF